MKLAAAWTGSACEMHQVRHGLPTSDRCSERPMERAAG